MQPVRADRAVSHRGYGREETAAQQQPSHSNKLLLLVAGRPVHRRQDTFSQAHAQRGPNFADGGRGQRTSRAAKPTPRFLGAVQAEGPAAGARTCAR